MRGWTRGATSKIFWFLFQVSKLLELRLRSPGWVTTVTRRTSTNHTQHSALTQKFRQNTNYLQIGGMNNWLYAVLTIFAQQSNFCSSKFEWLQLYSSPLLLPLTTVTWPCGFDSFVASPNTYQPTSATKRHVAWLAKSATAKCVAYWQATADHFV